MCKPTRTQTDISQKTKNVGARWIHSLAKRHMSYVVFRPGLHDIGLLFMPDRFPESGTKNAPEYECLHEAWKTAQ